MAVASPTARFRQAPATTPAMVAATVYLLIVGATIAYPKSLTGGGDPGHIGIAPAVPAVATYTIVVGGLVLLLIYRALAAPVGRVVPPSMWLLLAGLVAGFAGAWAGTAEQQSGMVQLTMGIAAWFLGSYLGSRALAHLNGIRLIALALLGLVLIELVLMAAQLAGIGLNPMDPATAALMGSRTNGTFPHPNNAGKALFLIVVLALGLIGTSDVKTRKILWLTIMLAFVPLALTQGRANLLAALLTVVFWALLSPKGSSFAVRVGVPLLAVLMVLPFVGTIFDRFAADPEGGQRPRLSATAIEQIAMRPVWGTGPNAYVTTVAPYDSLVATGYPVHNAFLLTAAELGIIVGVLFWVPVLALILRCWGARSRPGLAGSFGVAILASVPGTYLILSTGWAMLAGSLLPLWFLILGTAYGQVSRPKGPASTRAPAPWVSR